jgi:nitrite reductase/ring-hydroxylating ferredoxin subunit
LSELIQLLEENNEEKDNKAKLNRIVICPSHELAPGLRTTVQIDRVEIVVANVDGTLYGFQSRCPHQGVPLEYGVIMGTMLPSDPHVYQYGCENEIVRCPLHGWEFNLKTGGSVFAPDCVKIKTYPVKEENGEIVLYLKKRDT